MNTTVITSITPRKPCVVGNWKMLGSLERIADLMQAFLNRLPLLKHAEHLDMVVCPPFPYLQWVQGFLQRAAAGWGETASFPVALGAQNVYFEPEGAFTGEVSASMLSDLNCRFVILGHSERRQRLQETDAVIARKFQAAYDTGLIPILCVGETQAERRAGQTLAVVLRQLHAVLEIMDPGVFRRAMIAYEPVWAIGTGQTASPEEASEVHAFLRSQFTTLAEGCTNELRILYGGSVKASNAAELFAKPDIDGALVGGASLNAEEFFRICQQAIGAKFT